jgi:hypothetical protein
MAAMTLLASMAFACTNLATISLSAEAARPGDTIILTGTSFRGAPRAQTGPTPTPVEVHWKSADGPILGTAIPDRAGTIAITFTVPESDPGPAVLVATQRTVIPNLTSPDAPPIVSDEYGTPARATLRILAPGERLGRDIVPSNFVIATSDGSSTALVIMLVLFGAVALSLFAGGVIAFLHQMRARQMVAQPWRYR